MVEILGQPKDHMLRGGIYTHFYFTKETSAHGPAWRFWVGTLVRPVYIEFFLFLLFSSNVSYIFYFFRHPENTELSTKWSLTALLPPPSLY